MCVRGCRCQPLSPSPFLGKETRACGEEGGPQRTQVARSLPFHPPLSFLCACLCILRSSFPSSAHVQLKRQEPPTSARTLRYTHTPIHSLTQTHMRRLTHAMKKREQRDMAIAVPRNRIEERDEEYAFCHDAALNPRHHSIFVLCCSWSSGP